MAMGRKLLPEHADSWGEFNARLELEIAGQDRARRLTPLWSSVAGLLFGLSLVLCAYAVSDHHWWLWLCMVATLAADVAMAMRAVDRVDRERAREAELARLRDSWLDHLERAGNPGGP